MNKRLLSLISFILLSSYTFSQCTPQITVNDDFETYTAGTTAGLPTCWSSIAPFSVLLGVRSDVADSYSGNQYINIYTFFNSNATVYIVSPELGTLDGNHFAEFYVKTAYTNVTLEYGTLSNPSDESTFISAGSAALNTDNTYTPITTGNIQPNTGHKYFALKFVAPTSHSGIKIDDFSWKASQTPAPCLAVQNVSASNITASTAEINWNAVGNNDYKIEYGTTGFVLGTGIISSTSATNTSISNLQSNTSYDVYITTDCGSENLADTAAKISFTTSSTSNLSLNETESNLINIYPNPATEKISIVLLSQGTYQLTDLSGKVVRSGLLNVQGNTDIMVNDLKNGLYILRVSTAQGSKVNRIIKQ